VNGKRKGDDAAGGNKAHGSAKKLATKSGSWKTGNQNLGGGEKLSSGRNVTRKSEGRREKNGLVGKE